MATKQKIISNKIENYLISNPNKLITRKELVVAVYGNAVNLQSKNRCIYEFIRRDVKASLTQKGYEIESKRRVGIKLIPLSSNYSQQL